MSTTFDERSRSFHFGNADPKQRFVSSRRQSLGAEFAMALAGTWIGVQLQQVLWDAVGRPLQLIAGEPHPGFVAQLFDAIGRRVGCVTDVAQRARARQQQIASDQVGETEVRVVVKDLLDFEQGGIEAVIANFGERAHEHCLGLEVRVAVERRLERRLSAHRACLKSRHGERCGGNQPHDPADGAGATEMHQKVPVQLPTRSC